MSNAPRAFVVMTALPPTLGHLSLIQFASRLSDNGVTVLVCTQPDEPYGLERAVALSQAVPAYVKVERLHRQIEQNPGAPGFWDMWRGIMTSYGFRPGDWIVASEPYGKRLAEEVGGKFFPYDMERVIHPIKATPIRDNPYGHFKEIIPEFQKHLRTTVTVFGAESTGKTTLSRDLAYRIGGYWLCEWARPFLENTSPDINIQSMTDIWYGQAALQRHADTLSGKPYVIQDTDLFSTVGYWQFPHWDSLGDPPLGLVEEAKGLKSDLYLVLRSNIPFEQDPLRYGGNVREGSDAYWIDVCERYGLPYMVINAHDRQERMVEAIRHTLTAGQAKAKTLKYNRSHNG